MIVFESHDVLSHVLTAEGSQIALQGSHEARVWAALPTKGEGAAMSTEDLKKAVGDESASIGQGRAFKSKWIGKEGNGFVKLVGCSDVVRVCLSDAHEFRFLRLKIKLRCK